jgi:hypothetical protein
MDQLWDENFRLTLGKLVQAISSKMRISDNLKTDLEQSIEARNNLAHSFFREHAENFLNPEGRRLMANELKRMREQLSSTDRQLQPIADRLWKILGITPEMVERVFQLMKAGASDADIDRAFENQRARTK